MSEQMIDKAQAYFDSLTDKYDVEPAIVIADFALEQTAELRAEVEALEAKLAAAERLINEINDARAANWHLQRRRENDQFEWFSSTADSVFGPFPTALEAFAAVRKESPKQGTISDMSTGYTGLITSKENTDA